MENNLCTHTHLYIGSMLQEEDTRAKIEVLLPIRGEKGGR